MLAEIRNLVPFSNADLSVHGLVCGRMQHMMGTFRAAKVFLDVSFDALRDGLFQFQQVAFFSLSEGL